MFLIYQEVHAIKKYINLFIFPHNAFITNNNDSVRNINKNISELTKCEHVPASPACIYRGSSSPGAGARARWTLDMPGDSALSSA